MSKVDRSILQSNDQKMGDFGDPDKLESSINHLADKIDENDTGFSSHKDASELAHPDKSVTEKKLADSSVSSRVIQAGAVGTRELDPAILSQPTSSVGVQAKLQEIDEQLAEVVNDANEFVLYSFFKSNTDHNTMLFVSSDGRNLKKINSNNLNVANMRDPSICYFNGYFLIAYTSFNPHDFKVSKSKDLVNWTTHDISLGLWKDSNSKIWAPEFFFDDTKLYVLISNREGADIVDVNGSTIPNFKPYIAECTSVETLTFSSPIAMSLEPGNKIDPCMIKHNNEYYVFIKDEYDKNIESWKSSTITGAYIKTSDNISALSNTEGYSIIKYKGTFYLYGDGYTNDIGITYFATSPDLATWSSRKQLKTKDRIRHGSAFVLSDDNAKGALRKFINANVVEEKNTKENSMGLASMATNNAISSLEIIDEMVYTVSGSEKITINAFANPFNAKRFYFHIASNTDASITIANGSSIVAVPTNTKWDAGFGDGDILIEFVFTEALTAFKPVAPNAKKFFDKKSLSVKPCWKRVNLVDVGVNQSQLAVEDGVLYVLSGSANGSIADVSSLPDGSRFYVAVFSGVANLTITSGTNITVPGGTFTIGATNGTNEAVYEFVKVPSSTFRLRK